MTSIIIALVTIVIMALAAVAWFAVQRWVTHVDGLQTSMDGLKDAINKLKSEFVTQSQHQEDLRVLRSESVLGRRAMDHCGALDCPYEKTAPVFHPTEGR